MKPFLTLWGYVALWFAQPLIARVDLLLAPPAEPISGAVGTEFVLHLNNLGDTAHTFELPTELLATFATREARGRVRLVPTRESDHRVTLPPMSRHIVVLRLAEALPPSNGYVSLRLASPASNAIMFERAPESPPAAIERPENVAVAPSTPANASTGGRVRRMALSARSLDLSSDVEVMRRHIFSYDPIYFSIGWRERLNARFQFSFKYRLFQSSPPGGLWLEDLVRSLHFGYTQTSIWDLEAFSKPFYDTSYKPTAFVLQEIPTFAPDSDWRLTVQVGVQHESNGKAGPAADVPTVSAASASRAERHPFDTRSLNTFYVAPRLRWSDGGELFFEARTTASAYFTTDENPDIQRYRGYVELSLRGGYDRGAQLSALVRGKVDGHGSVELNLTWPAFQTPLLRHLVPPALGGYAHIQYFNGYGESLLDYDVRRKDQLRFGLMLVR